MYMLSEHISPGILSRTRLFASPRDVVDNKETRYSLQIPDDYGINLSGRRCIMFLLLKAVI